MSHFTVAVITAKKEKLEEMLAPYDENLEVEPYIERTKEEIIKEARKRKEDYYKEQKEAMKRLKMHKDFAGMDNGCCVVNAKDLEIVLTLIEKQKEQIDYLRRSCNRKEECLIEEQQENAELKNKLKEKDKIIDLMAERAVLTEEEWKEIKEKNIYNVIQKDTHKLIKQYFENKAIEV